MRTLLFLLLPLFAAAQPKGLKEVTMTTDSTFAQRPDGVYYSFVQDEKNVKAKTIPTFQWDIVHRSGNKEVITLSSGPLTAREYLNQLRTRKDIENADLGRSLRDVDILRARRDALKDEIDRVVIILQEQRASQ